MKKKTIRISGGGKPPVTMKKGALHLQLGVPVGQPIPAAKKRDALAGKYGPLAKKRAVAAFKGILAAGRKTVAKKSMRDTTPDKTESKKRKLAEKRTGMKS